jgi:uncharacterized protein (UPF0335 family)
MAKFKIAQNPTFKVDVDIPRVGGTTIKVPFEFKYRDRKDLAELFVAWQEAARQEDERFRAMGADVDLVELTKSNINRQVDQVTQLVASWGFDDKLNEESIRALVETSAGAGEAIADAYRKAFTVVRLGN